ncbi:hypothetical protein BJ508DRAFT_304421 [Ascobolus immersus RN42]|uniref:Uncharacterized protein n=1 Tax=Ascobolus immersus RN42 TaxID=1160509 RepID=A0A3N4IDN7_ASCIM|nr:hypothetical protein BJ508DRAFT_304421 [Ascobolus immersus RN42]
MGINSANLTREDVRNPTSESQNPKPAKGRPKAQDTDSCSYEHCVRKDRVIQTSVLTDEDVSGPTGSIEEAPQKAVDVWPRIRIGHRNHPRNTAYMVEIILRRDGIEHGFIYGPAISNTGKGIGLGEPADAWYKEKAGEQRMSKQLVKMGNIQFLFIPVKVRTQNDAGKRRQPKQVLVACHVKVTTNRKESRYHLSCFIKAIRNQQVPGWEDDLEHAQIEDGSKHRQGGAGGFQRDQSINRSIPEQIFFLLWGNFNMKQWMTAKNNEERAEVRDPTSNCTEYDLRGFELKKRSLRVGRKYKFPPLLSSEDGKEILKHCNGDAGFVLEGGGNDGNSNISSSFTLSFSAEGSDSEPLLLNE